MDNLFIESDSFSSIISEIDRKASKEKGPGRPPFWEIVLWWGREPLLSARAFITAALLPEDFSIEEYKTMIRLDKDLPHKFNPEITESFRNSTFLDPFAGFGSFALEAKRLGFKKVIASDPIPTAYTFLKGVLVYPKYGQKLIKDIEKYGQDLIESLKDDIKELYGDYTGYVGSWEVKCPVCGNYTPLSFAWNLLELKRSGSESEGEEGEENTRVGTFRRIVYMKPIVENISFVLK
ncbi:DUF1156 domain-containing protein [Sulfolobus sp. S-194]|uniref:DUF1156 domain-containing protein n=1 Tax=Sulfolobus sp. S-194 TaxID=2512240 RepID=UPI0025701B20|nr:DUF1156 domain-containing protein [Sulfolobus sp. S-194]